MKKVYRIISTILTMVMVASSLPVVAAPNEAAYTQEASEAYIQTPAEPASDESSDVNYIPSEGKEAQNPRTNSVSSTAVPEGYIPVSNVEDLKDIDKNDDSRGKNYYLTNDIDMLGVGNFDPIGTEDKDFHGTFDGGGHVIYNLNVDTGKGDYAGLFGCVGSGGTVKNLGVEGTVKGDNYVGGLVGWLSDEAILENCYFKGNVSGVENVGGLVGYSGDKGCCGGSSQIMYCYHIGNVTGSKNVGGIVGQVILSPYGDVDACVEWCYNIGTFRDAENLGGIIGSISKYGVMNANYLFDKCVYVNTDIRKEIGLVGENDHGYNYRNFSSTSIEGFSGPGVAEKYDLSQGYTSPPQQTSADGQRYYYPQLNCFVTDKNDLSQFPYNMPYTYVIVSE